MGTPYVSGLCKRFFDDSAQRSNIKSTDLRMSKAGLSLTDFEVTRSASSSAGIAAIESNAQVGKVVITLP
jgi:hypothetical protein